MFQAVLCLMVGLSASAAAFAAPPLVRIAPPSLKVRDFGGEIGATDTVAGLAYGDLSAPSSFPRFTVDGITPRDRSVCITIRDEGKHHEWSFVWRRTPDIGEAHHLGRVTFELVRAGNGPEGDRALDAAIAAKASKGPTCDSASPYLPSWWSRTAPRTSTGAILVNAQGATDVWLSSSEGRASCTELRSSPGARGENWTAYSVSCPIPPIACGREQDLQVIRAQGDAFAPPISLRLRGVC